MDTTSQCKCQNGAWNFVSVWTKLMSCLQWLRCARDCHCVWHRPQVSVLQLAREIACEIVWMSRAFLERRALVIYGHMFGAIEHYSKLLDSFMCTTSILLNWQYSITWVHFKVHSLNPKFIHVVVLWLEISPLQRCHMSQVLTCIISPI